MNPKVSIVIVNWNGIKFLQNFIPVLYSTNYSNFEVVLADNDSKDESVSWIKSSFPQTKILQFDQNYGFAEGNNKAVQTLDSQYVVLLNSDVEVTQNWLQPLVDWMEKHPNVGAVQPKVRAFHQKSHFEYAGASGGFIDKMGYPFCRGRILNEIEEDLGQYEDPIECFWATGACMLIRRELISKVGGLFDSKLFAHMEEIDFCWRLKNNNYSVWAIPESIVYHVGGGTLANGNPKKDFLNIRNSLIVMTKNLSFSELIPKIIIRLLLDDIAFLRNMTKGEFQLFFTVVKAHFSYYSFIPYALNERYKNPNVKLSKLSGVLKKLMIWQFFVKKKKKFSEIWL